MFEQAEQFNTTLAHVMGLRPKEDAPSYNELKWWASYRSYLPAYGERIDILEARLLGVHTGKDPKLVKMNWFNPIYDPDVIEELITPEHKELAKANKEAYEEECRKSSSK